MGSEWEGTKNEFINFDRLLYRHDRDGRSLCENEPDKALRIAVLESSSMLGNQSQAMNYFRYLVSVHGYEYILDNTISIPPASFALENQLNVTESVARMFHDYFSNRRHVNVPLPQPELFNKYLEKTKDDLEYSVLKALQDKLQKLETLEPFSNKDLDSIIETLGNESPENREDKINRIKQTLTKRFSETPLITSLLDKKQKEDYRLNEYFRKYNLIGLITVLFKNKKHSDIGSSMNLVNLDKVANALTAFQSLALPIADGFATYDEHGYSIAFFKDDKNYEPHNQDVQEGLPLEKIVEMFWDHHLIPSDKKYPLAYFFMLHKDSLPEKLTKVIVDKLPSDFFEGINSLSKTEILKDEVKALQVDAILPPDFNKTSYEFLNDQLNDRINHLPYPDLIEEDDWTGIISSQEDYQQISKQLQAMSFDSILFLQESIGIELGNLSRREFYSLFVFLKNNRRGEGFAKLHELVGSFDDGKNKLNRVKSFLTMETSVRNGEQLIEINRIMKEKGFSEEADLIFKKIAEIVDYVQVNEDELRDRTGENIDINDLRLELLKKAGEIIDRFSDKDANFDRLLYFLDKSKTNLIFMVGLVKAGDFKDLDQIKILDSVIKRKGETLEDLSEYLGFKFTSDQILEFYLNSRAFAYDVSPSDLLDDPYYLKLKDKLKPENIKNFEFDFCFVEKDLAIMANYKDIDKKRVVGADFTISENLQRMDLDPTKPRLGMLASQKFISEKVDQGKSVESTVLARNIKTCQAYVNGVDPQNSEVTFALTGFRPSGIMEGGDDEFFSMAAEPLEKYWSKETFFFDDFLRSEAKDEDLKRLLKEGKKKIIVFKSNNLTEAYLKIKNALMLHDKDGQIVAGQQDKYEYHLTLNRKLNNGVYSVLERVD